MKDINFTTVAIGLVVGYIAYKIVNKDKSAKTSSFSSACGCGA